MKQDISKIIKKVKVFGKLRDLLQRYEVQYHEGFFHLVMTVFREINEENKIIDNFEWKQKKDAEIWLIDNWKYISGLRKVRYLQRRYRINGGIIDILGEDEEGYVVIELKKATDLDKAIPQILHHIVTLEEEKSRKTRGIIFTTHCSPTIRKMIANIQNIEVIAIHDEENPEKDEKNVEEFEPEPIWKSTLENRINELKEHLKRYYRIINTCEKLSDLNSSISLLINENNLSDKDNLCLFVQDLLSLCWLNGKKDKKYKFKSQVETSRDDLE